MAARAIGALFGLVAVILVAGSAMSPVVTPKLPAWWDGAPTIDGKTFDRMDVEVGPLGALHCFDSGNNCKHDVTIDSTFQAIGYGELGALGLVALVALALAISVWRVGDRRKGLARIALALAMIAGAGSVLLVVFGPDVHAMHDEHTLDVGVPLGIGMFMVWGGLFATGVAAIAALRVQPEPLRLKSSAAFVPEPPDVRELVRAQHDQLRPAALGPEPMLGAPANPGKDAPLFEGAPQLRPLFDVQGAAPVPQRHELPQRAPTPMPRDSMRALAGIETPPSPRKLEHPPAPRSGSPDRPDSGPIDPPPPLRVPTMPDSPLRPKTLPPPRAKAPSQAPRAPTPKVPAPPEKKTIAHAIPPPPTPDDLPPPEKLPAKLARVGTDLDDRLETGMRETDAITTVEVDAEAKAKYVARQRQVADRHAAETAQLIDGSDTGVELVARGQNPTDVSSTVEPPVEPTEQSTTPPPPPAEPPPRPESLSERAMTNDVEAAKPTTQMAVAISTAPATLPPPKPTAAQPASGPTPACPQCESPMAWVEEHLRFYCKQCRMYF